MANLVLGGIKFSDTQLRPKEHDKKFEEYWKKFEEITLDFIKHCRELESNNDEFVFPIHYKVTDIVGKTFKVDGNTYKFTTPCVTDCIERFNEENFEYQIVSKVPKNHFGQNDAKGRGKKIIYIPDAVEEKDESTNTPETPDTTDKAE